MESDVWWTKLWMCDCRSWYFCWMVWACILKRQCSLNFHLACVEQRDVSVELGVGFNYPGVRSDSILHHTRFDFWTVGQKKSNSRLAHRFFAYISAYCESIKLHKHISFWSKEFFSAVSTRRGLCGPQSRTDKSGVSNIRTWAFFVYA